MSTNVNTASRACSKRGSGSSGNLLLWKTNDSRFYNLREKKYFGFAGPRLSRKAFAELSGISVQALKAHDHHPELRLKPITQRRLAAAQILMRANLQQDLIDDKADRAAAKAAAARERQQDKALDKALARCRPLSKRARQQSVF